MEDMREIFETITMTDSVENLNTIIQWCEDRKEDVTAEKYINLLATLCDTVDEIVKMLPYEETPFYDDYCILNWSEVLIKLEKLKKEKEELTN